jgi:hypothetical protein
MFVKLDENQDYSNSGFGELISSQLNIGNDCFLVFGDYVFLIMKGDKPETFEAGLFLSDKIEKHYIFTGDFIETEINIRTAKDIGYVFFSKIRDLKPELKLVDFPIQDIIIGLVDDYQNHLFNK